MNVGVDKIALEHESDSWAEEEWEEELDQAEEEVEDGPVCNWCGSDRDLIKTYKDEDGNVIYQCKPCVEEYEMQEWFSLWRR